MIDSYIIDNFESFESLQKMVRDEAYDMVALDLETNSSQEKLAKIWGIGLSFTGKEGFYLPIRDKEGHNWFLPDQELDIYAWVYDLCKSKKLIGHNILYDVLVWENNTEQDISEFIFADTMMLKHTVMEERPHGLKECAVKYLGTWADLAQEDLYASIEANGGKTNKNDCQMHKADTDILGRYCAWDAALTFQLYNYFLPKLKEEGLEKFFFEEEVMPLYKEVTIPMKRHGFPVDVPYFEQLHKDISEDINRLETEILDELKDQLESYVRSVLNEEFPCKRTGNFPKALADIEEIKLPEKNGKVTLAKAELKKLESSHWFYQWLLGDDSKSPPTELIRKVQYKLYFDKNPEDKSVFNLSSNDHLGWLFFQKMGLKPLSKTEGGKPQCDEEFLDSIKVRYPFVQRLIDYKKLQKLDSTYILGILERQIDGVLYSSMLQHGTTSGRYSSTNPNLQNQPRVKGEDADISPMVLKYANGIRKGLVAPKGYVLLDADYAALEPRSFADMSGDHNLQNIFFSGEDMYSAIAKRVFNMGDEVSTYKKDKNFLGNLYPEKRQIIKAMALAVTYGAEAGRISQLLNISKEEAQQIIEDYLDAFPGLKNYMKESDTQAKQYGMVKTKFGRIRHLPHVQRIYKTYGDKIKDYRYANQNGIADLRKIYKNGLNNAKNARIQGLAAHITNRAMIAINREFKKNGIDGHVALMIHDQIISIVRADQAEKAKSIQKDCMENTTKISVPLIAEPKLALNLKESH